MVVVFTVESPVVVHRRVLSLRRKFLEAAAVQTPGGFLPQLILRAIRKKWENVQDRKIL